MTALRRASLTDVERLLEARPLEAETAPTLAHLQTVQGCPLSCVMCSVRRTRPREIERAALETVEPYLPLLRVLGLHAQGEPLLGDLGWIAERSRAHGFVIHMNTTGSLLDARTVETLVRTPLSIRFSVHAGRPATYEHVMGQPFRRTMENIRRMTRRARESGTTSEFWFSFLVMRGNVDEIEDLIQLAASCDVKHVRFMRLRPHRAILRGVRPDRGDERFRYFRQFGRDVVREYSRRLPAAISLATSLGVRIESGSVPVDPRSLHTVREVGLNLARKIRRDPAPERPTRRRGTCVVPWLGQLQIEQDLSVKLCCASDTTLGRLGAEPLDAVWNGPRMRSIRSSFRAGFFPRACGLCPGLALDDYPNIAFSPLDGARRSPGAVPKTG